MRLLLAALLLPTPALAQDFSCRNEAAEIRCNDGGCEIETQGFTPMSLSRTGNRLEICAYSGCWSGPILVSRTRGDLILLYAETRGSDALAVIYDRKAQVAQIRWGGFANAMGCKQ